MGFYIRHRNLSFRVLVIVLNLLKSLVFEKLPSSRITTLDYETHPTNKTFILLLDPQNRIMRM